MNLKARQYCNFRSSDIILSGCSTSSSGYIIPEHKNTISKPMLNVCAPNCLTALRGRQRHHFAPRHVFVKTLNRWNVGEDKVDDSIFLFSPQPSARRGAGAEGPACLPTHVSVLQDSQDATARQVRDEESAFVHSSPVIKAQLIPLLYRGSHREIVIMPT